MSDRKLQNLFKSHLNYLDLTPQPLKNRKAISAISYCRTAEMGTSYFTCKAHHQPVKRYHSCRNRSCYLCAFKAKQNWIEKQKTRLLNVPHFHVVFTLPHEYLSLWRYNESLFASILFKASKETLLDLIGDNKYHGLTPGLMIALHTWGRQLTLHPHTHCLITAGGVNGSKQWQEIEQFLLPIRVVKTLYRGKVQGMLKAALKEQALCLPPDMRQVEFHRLHRQAYQKEWSVRIEKRYEHGKGVMLYLSRYLKGGPVTPEQIGYGQKKGLVLRYFDHRDKRIKHLDLDSKELIKRILEHVPPIGIHTVRHYGIYAASSKSRQLDVVTIKGTLEGAKIGTGERLRDMVLLCKTCKEPVYLSYRSWKKLSKAFSINRASNVPTFVQPADDADIVTGMSERSWILSSP